MAKIYLEEGDTTHARNLWQELISSAGESQTAYNGLVLCDIQDGDYASALENVDKGLVLSGEEARQELMYNAIVACERQGDFDTARTKAQEYVEKYPADERGTREYTFPCRRGKLMGMNTIEELKERVILIGVSTSDGDDTDESLKELKELADTAGAETVGTVIQNREAVHPGTYIGKGKIEEVRAMAFGPNATGVICDDELSPAQPQQPEQELDLKVMDRTLIILDIFAAHARTSEGKIQVELAQLKYRQARLVGLRNSLSRLGGGIGTRGPGEKKLR